MKGTERQWKDIDIKPGTVIMGLYTRLVGRTSDPALH